MINTHVMQERMDVQRRQCCGTTICQPLLAIVQCATAVACFSRRNSSHKAAASSVPNSKHSVGFSRNRSRNSCVGLQLDFKFEPQH